MKRYEVVQEQTLVRLSEELNELLKDGYELQGGICACPLPKGGILFFQAITKG
ncbi:DUF1737 domain-containing protein [Lacinutrix himadriensis]|uniref:DUF1737 domain-containing protein n=1 Tax=Lacinutrix himadriensis TaxID=641549 RepID=UPI0009F9AD55|nr:DUF1737 domain-containing protein [Lacinutrix himadriensis]